MSINCTFPPELDDRQLLAYLDGESDEKAISHILGCAYCRQKAEELGALQKHLITRLYRLDCPSSIELGEYHLHLLSASQMLVISQHVRECPHCTREIAQLESFLNDQTFKPEGNLLGQVKLLLARLVGSGDTALTPAAPALRGEGKGPLTFAADGIIIVLDVQPGATGTLNILGQIAADDQAGWTGALVELRRNSLLQISTTVDDLGAFRCEGIRPGQQELRIIPKNGSIVVMSYFDASV